MKSSTCSLFPSKILGSFPIALMSAAAGTGCCGCRAGCPSPLPPPLPPPPPPPPPPLPPPPPPSWHRALSKWLFRAAREVVALIVAFFGVVVVVEVGSVVVWVAIVGCEVVCVSPGTVICMGALVVMEAVGSGVMMFTGLFRISSSRVLLEAMLLSLLSICLIFLKACLGCLLSASPSSRACCAGTMS